MITPLLSAYDPLDPRRRQTLAPTTYSDDPTQDQGPPPDPASPPTSQTLPGPDAPNVPGPPPSPNSEGPGGLGGQAPDPNGYKMPGDLKGRLNRNLTQEGFTQWVRDAFAAQGKQANDGDVNYWWGKWNQFGMNDPGYFYDRFMTPDGGPEGGSSAGGPGGPGGASAGSNPFLDSVRSTLMKLIGDAQQPVTENSPEVAVPYNAAANVAQVNRAAEQKALAESQYAEGRGSSSSALDQGIQQSYEREAGNLASIKGQLISRVYDAKRQQLMQGLQMAMSSGDAESARSLQLMIAQLDIAYRYASLAQQQGQFNDNYGLELNNAQYQRDRDAARAAAGLPY